MDPKKRKWKENEFMQVWKIVTFLSRKGIIQEECKLKVKILKMVVKNGLQLNIENERTKEKIFSQNTYAY